MPALPLPLVRIDDPSVSAEIVGNKFARLVACRDVAVVPDAVCIPTEWFTEALGDHRFRQIHTLFADLAATLGNEAAALEAKIATILDGLSLTNEMRNSLNGTLTRLATTSPGPAFAVRSSTTVEDGMSHSHAGLYETRLNLTTPPEIARAVIDCWRSFYSPRAILARIRAGSFDPEPRMALIIQQMIRPQLSGVAFTQRDQTSIDAVPGTGDKLVSGHSHTDLVRIEAGTQRETPFPEVGSLAQALREKLRYDVDIEWAWDGTRTFLLQVRPVTAPLHLRTATHPVFTHASLYFDDTLPPDLHLGTCAEVYFSYTAKRSPLYRLAHRHRIRTGRGWIVALNGSGLAQPRHLPEWWNTMTSTVVLDLGANLRQHILPAADLPRFLHQALNLDGDPTTIHPLIIREFTHGEAGIVTHRANDDGIIIEHSPQGLLAINRGLANPDRLTLPPLHDANAWHTTQAPDRWGQDALHQLAHFTEVLDHDIPGAHVEWVLNEGHPQFIDASVPHQSGTTSPIASTNGTTTTTTIVAAGNAQGPLLHIEDNEELTKLSIAPIISVNFRADTPPSPYITRLTEHIQELPAKPIIYARRPYVILSLLLQHAAGFVFQGGSTLCHLAILLREAHIPAVIAPHMKPPTGPHTAAITNDTVRIWP